MTTSSLPPIAGISARRTMKIVSKVYEELPEIFSGEMVIMKILEETRMLEEAVIAAFYLGCKVTNDNK
jgi:hypothetical protein